MSVCLDVLRVISVGLAVCPAGGEMRRGHNRSQQVRAGHEDLIGHMGEGQVLCDLKCKEL